MNARHTNRRTRRSVVTRAVGTVFESMEQRRLMSGTLTITPNSGNDSITIDVTAAGGVRKIINGVTTNYPPGQWSDITINAMGDNEQLTIRGSVVPIDIFSVYAPTVTFGGPQGLQEIKAAVSFQGTSGHLSTINLNDTGNNAARNVVMAETFGGVVQVQNFAPALISLTDGCFGAVNVTTGGGNDTFELRDLPVNTSMNFNSAGGTDTVKIGGGVYGAEDIHGQVTINNGPSLTHLVVDDSAVGDAGNIYMNGDGTYDAIHGMAQSPIEYKVADVADVTLNLPSGGSVVHVDRTDKPLKIVGIHTGLYFCDDIEIGNGANGMADIHAPVTTSNPNSIYYVELNDQNDPSARRIQVDTNPVTQMDSVTGMSGGAVQWASGDPVIATLHTANVGGNGVVVRGVDANNYVIVSGDAPIGGPNDVVTVGDSGSVQRIAGLLKIQNAGYSALTVDDSADATARAATLDVYDASVPNYTWSLSGLAPGKIYFNAYDVAALTIKGGSGGNTFNIANTPGSSLYGASINLFTGTGADTVNVLGMVSGNVVNIEGQSGLDVVNVGQNGLTAGIRGTVNVTNAASYTQLIIDDSADATARTVTLDALPPSGGDMHPWGKITGIAPGVINYRANDMKDPITIKGGSGGNTVVVNNTPTKTVGFVGGNTINLNTGTGADHVTIKAIAAGTTLNLDGQASTDAVIVGNNGSVQAILGTLNIANKNAYEAVTIDDSADAVNRTVTISVLGAVPGNTQGTISGLAPGLINFVAADINGFAIDGGGGADTYTVTGTPTTNGSGVFGPTLTLNAGGGADVINVLGMGNGTGLKVNGEAGDDTLIVDYTTGQMPLKHNITFDGGAAGQFGNQLSIKGLAADTINMTAGHISKGANGHVDYANVNTLYCAGGTFTAGGDMNLGALVAQSAATNVLFNSSQTIGKLYLDGAKAAMASGGALSLALNNLTIVNNATLDLADESMLLTYGNAADPVSAMRGYLSTGFDAGKWDGNGITSSVAQNDAAHHTGIGYVDSADGTGSNPTPNSIKFRYTLYGDTNLDRTVDLTDFTFLAANFNGTGKGWSQGDFTFNGTVDLTDFTYLAGNFNQTLPGPAAPVMATAAQARVRAMFSDAAISAVTDV